MEAEFMYFIVAAVLEFAAAIMLIFFFDSPCITGGEIIVFVNVYTSSILPVLVTDLMAVLFRFINLAHLDPLANFFEMANGLLCLVGGVSLVAALVFYCGNNAMIVVGVAGGCTILAGIAHFLRARAVKNEE